MVTKSDLRFQYRSLRRALPAIEVERRSQLIAELCFSREGIFPSGTPPLTVHTFLPVVRQQEVDTWPVIHRIWREFPLVSLAASITNPVQQTLAHFPVTPDTQLIENRWGIPEPLPVSDCIPPAAFDLVLVPLLAFDRRGNRVGYGGGYYDRFLAQCRPDCLKVGLSLFPPVDTTIDTEPTDIPLNRCVTPDGVFTF